MGTLAISDDLLEKIAAMAATSRSRSSSRSRFFFRTVSFAGATGRPWWPKLDRIAAMTPKDVRPDG